MLPPWVNPLAFSLQHIVVETMTSLSWDFTQQLMMWLQQCHGTQKPMIETRPCPGKGDWTDWGAHRLKPELGMKFCRSWDQNLSAPILIYSHCNHIKWTPVTYAGWGWPQGLSIIVLYLESGNVEDIGGEIRKYGCTYFPVYYSNIHYMNTSNSPMKV